MNRPTAGIFANATWSLSAEDAKRLTGDLDGITNSVDMNLSKIREIVMEREGQHAAVHGVTKSGLSDLTTNTT